MSVEDSKTVPLGDVSASIQYGFTTSAVLENVGPRLLRITDIQNGAVNWDSVPFCYCDDIAKYSLSSGDIVFARTGATTGKSFLVENAPPSIFASYLIRLRLKPHVFPKFVYYFFQSERYWSQINRNIVGSTQGGFNASKLSEITIPVPKLDEQKKIANILAQADTALQKRREANRLTEQFLQSAFLEMFGDPVRNERGWEVRLLGELSVHVSSGSTPLGGSSVYQDSGIMFIRSQNILMNKFDVSDVAFISEKIHHQMQRTWLKSDDVLLNITGASIGRTTVFKGPDDSANVNQHVCIIRINKRQASPDFVSYQLSLPSYQELILSRNSGATRQAFTFDQIKNFRIIAPPIQQQEKFAALMEQLQHLYRKQHDSEWELERLFQSLMQRYFGT